MDQTYPNNPKSNEKLVIRIVPQRQDEVDFADLEKIKHIIYKRTGPINLDFEIVDNIQTTPAGKWRIIIREGLQ